MSTVIHYCDRCGLRVSPTDISAGRAAQVDELTVYCEKCIPKGFAYRVSTATDARERTPTSRRVIVEAPPAPRSLARHLMMSLGAGTVVGVIATLLLMSGGDDVSAVSAT